MRKFLSLVLALVMMMSLVTINAGAKEFTDGDDITYREAVDVISTIHVVDGYSDGDFKPGNNLSRGAAAKIICNMILGPTTAAELHADTAPYRDVPVTSDFAGYIAYCQKEGIISGYADGSFRPAGTLTGYAFMKMLLGALGYDAEIEGYTGPNWSINVAKKAIGLGLNNSLEKTFNGVDFVTREEAALYAFNTLKADLVEYSSKITATVNGAEVAIGNSNAEPQKWESQKTRSDNIYKDGLVQFAEQYFNKLVLTEDMDVFGRPDREWRYDGDDIGAYINMDLFKQEYTTKVTGKDLYDLLGSRVVDEKDGYHFEIHVDGENTQDVLGSAYFTQGKMVRTNTDKVGETGNGVLTQVFVDNDKEVETVWIAVINTYLAKAAMDYNEKKDEVTYDVWSVADPAVKGVQLVKTKPADKDDDAITTPVTVKGEDFAIEDVKKDDIVLVHVADGTIQEFVEPEVLSDQSINAFKNQDWIKSEGEQYDYASSAQYDREVLDQYSHNNMKDVTFNLFLDEYGYLIGLEQNEDPDQYVFITGNDGGSSDLRNKEADMGAIFLDGTMKVISVNVKDSTGDLSGGAIVNKWFTYTVNDKDIYTLKEIPTDLGTGKKAQWAQNVTDYDAGLTGDAAILKNTVNNNSTTTYTIDKAHVALLSGGKKTDAATVDTTIGRVYGNEDTVYINVSTDVITTKTKYETNSTTDTGNGYAKVDNTTQDTTNWYLGTDDDKNLAVIIDDVDAITVGVQNASIEVKDVVAGNYKKSGGTAYTAAELVVPKSEIYTLYDKDGYVIAAVVIGEDQGTTAKYAYVHTDDVEREEYADGKWNWERKVIIDGEIVTLKEVTDSDWAYIQPLDNATNFATTKGMIQGAWYKVSFNADGNVKKAEPYTTFGDKYVTNVTDVEPTYDGTLHSEKLIILEANYTGAGNNLPGNDGIGAAGRDNPAPAGHLPRELVYEAGTLWTNKATREGFYIAPNAKIVYVNAKLDRSLDAPTGVFADVDWFDDVVDGYTRTDMDRVLKLIDSYRSGQFCGVLTAVIEDGVATSVIINDTYGMAVDTGSDTTPQSDKYYSTVDQTVTNGNGLSEMDMSDPVKFSINDRTYTVTTMNVLDATSNATVAAQIKEFLTYKGYKNLGDVFYDGSSNYQVTATDPNGMDTTVTIPTASIHDFYTVTIDSAKKYLGAGTKLDDAGVTTGKHAKMVLNGVTSAIDSGDIGTGADLAITAGAEYTSDAYTKVTATDITPAANFTTSTCKYTVSFAIGTGDAVKSAASTYYIGKDATLVATITGDANMAADFTAAGKAKDTVTLTATGMTGTGGTAVFGTTAPDTLTAKTITITGPASTVADVTVSFGATTA